jgi:CubicO group peptidase (beta-lactamase class C family)
MVRPHASVVAARVNGELVFRELIEGTAHPIGTSDSARLRFPIYSITKTVTAVCALRLQESGELDLDARVGHWFPESPLHRTMTVTHLLRHDGADADRLAGSLIGHLLSRSLR